MSYKVFVEFSCVNRQLHFLPHVGTIDKVDRACAVGDFEGFDVLVKLNEKAGIFLKLQNARKCSTILVKRWLIFKERVNLKQYCVFPPVKA